jgi:hypothetical protein
VSLLGKTNHSGNIPAHIESKTRQIFSSYGVLYSECQYELEWMGKLKANTYTHSHNGKKDITFSVIEIHVFP